MDIFDYIKEIVISNIKDWLSCLWHVMMRGYKWLRIRIKITFIKLNSEEKAILRAFNINEREELPMPMSDGMVLRLKINYILYISRPYRKQSPIGMLAPFRISEHALPIITPELIDMQRDNALPNFMEDGSVIDIIENGWPEERWQNL